MISQSNVGKNSLRCSWVVVETDYANKIFVIEDIANLTGGTTITNDAENVLHYVVGLFGPGWRTVYKDTDNEWFEILWKEDSLGCWVEFKRWNGLAWDLLQRQLCENSN